MCSTWTNIKKDVILLNITQQILNPSILRLLPSRVAGILNPYIQNSRSHARTHAHVHECLTFGGASSDPPESQETVTCLLISILFLSFCWTFSSSNIMLETKWKKKKIFITNITDHRRLYIIKQRIVKGQSLICCFWTECKGWFITHSF